jgi:hypothetical protein
MGGKSSKEVPEFTGDERYMESQDKRSVYYGLKWRKNYGIETERTRNVSKSREKERDRDMETF